MVEKVRILTAYCSEEFKKNVLPFLYPFESHESLKEIKFKCDDIGKQDEWDELLDELKSSKYTHVVVDRKLRKHMTSNQYDLLKRRASQARTLFKLQSPNGGLSIEEISADIGDFINLEEKNLYDLLREEEEERGTSIE